MNTFYLELFVDAKVRALRHIRNTCFLVCGTILPILTKYEWEPTLTLPKGGNSYISRQTWD